MAKLKGIPKERQEELEKVKRRGPVPARTIESREKQITRLVYDLVEEKVRKKTATSQELLHFLKLGSSLSQLERAKLEKEVLLLKAKEENLKSQKNVELLYATAMKAFRRYSGQEEESNETDQELF